MNPDHASYAVFILREDGEDGATCSMPGIAHDHLHDAEREARERANAGHTCLVIKMTPIAFFRGVSDPLPPN